MKKILYLYLSLNINIYSIINQNVLICGVCQNVEKPLPYTIKIMESIGNLFINYQIIVYENNSVDRTAQILKKWQSENNKVNIYSQNLSINFFYKKIVNLYDKKHNLGIFFRPELIAYARNFVLEKAMSDKYKEFDYIIWMDMDFKRMPNLKGIIEVFESTQEWDAVFANGIHPDGKFYDWYALRDNKYLLGGELLGAEWWRQLKSKKLNLNFNDDWHPVYSAFGGCGIYKKSSIIGCKYSALITQDLEILMRKLIAQWIKHKHPDALKYVNNLKKLSIINRLQSAVNLPKINHRSTTGIKISEKPNNLIWRLDNYTSQYPGVCEHVTFHASMILNGHNKLFINPRMIFTYN